MPTYSFTGQDGKPVEITGESAMKAYLAQGGLEFLLAGQELALAAEDGGEGDDDEASH